MKKEFLFILISLALVSYANAATISGNVFDDFNGDSILANETEINATLIIFDINTFSESLINSDENGYYKFDVKPGSYMVMQKLNANEIFTYPEFGFYHIVVNSEDETFNDNNFGNFKLGKISGYVYDLNNVPILNMQVNLSNNFTYLTDKSGYYEFTNLDPGNYGIMVQDKVINDLIINSGANLDNNFNVDYKPVIEVKEEKENGSWITGLISLFT